MNKSDSIGALAAALAKAQAAMGGAKKDSDNPFFKSHYADLAAVVDAIKKPLADNELAYVQATDLDDGGVVVETVLMRSSGEWISGRLRMVPVKPDPQGIGSCVSYARRYGLQALVGVPSEDDDGNAASGQQQDGKAKPKAAPLIQPPAANQDAYRDQTPNGCTAEARKWFFGRLKEDLGIDHTEAVRLLDIKSLKEDMGDKTFGQILEWTKMAMLKDKAQQPNGTQPALVGEPPPPSDEELLAMAKLEKAAANA